ncbi:MAG: phosphodiester glycosidase family protein [Pseudomonadota bacterium]
MYGVIWKLSAILLLWAAPAAASVTCERLSFEETRFSACWVDVATGELRLFLNGPEGTPYGSFDAIEEALGPLAFGMNAGMYHEDRRPVGHYMEDGTEAMRVIPTPGPGNFGMLPNGILCISAGSVRVWETRRYVEDTPACDHATQSGPMLVIDGDLHPRLLPDGTSRRIRNGVGTTDDGGRAIFVISDEGVNFHTFARIFRDHFGLNQALYLDGNISRMHAPRLDRSDRGVPMGPIVGVLARPEESG